MIFPKFIPYKLIGKIVVFLFFVAVLVALLIALYTVWYRGLTKIADYMWKGVDYHNGEVPVYWKRAISLTAIGLREFNPHRIPRALNNARDVDDDEKVKKP